MIPALARFAAAGAPRFYWRSADGRVELVASGESARIETSGERRFADAAEQAEALLALGPANVLVKGGHGTGDDSVDILVGKDGRRERLVALRIATQNTHGTGCTLSSAIASGLAHGIALNEAVALAKRYISAAIAASDAVKVGRGHGPVHHFHHWWDRPDGSKP